MRTVSLNARPTTMRSYCLSVLLWIGMAEYTPADCHIDMDNKSRDIIIHVVDDTNTWTTFRASVRHHVTVCVVLAASAYNMVSCKMYHWVSRDRKCTRTHLGPLQQIFCYVATRIERYQNSNHVWIGVMHCPPRHHHEWPSQLEHL